MPGHPAGGRDANFPVTRLAAGGYLVNNTGDA